jgi:hypothetical protein
MAKPFFDRLRKYYADVGKVLRGEADAASVFPNTTDIGMSREKVYAEFLRQHAPSKCNVVYGGFLFDEEGAESKQVDVIVTTDTCPQFNFHNRDGQGKTFACVEGTLAVASIKSSLTKAELNDALDNIASIPETRPLAGRIPPNLRIHGYEDWPYKIVYAPTGLAADTILAHVYEYYRQNSTIPDHRRPNIIHVAGAYFIHRAQGNEMLDGARALQRGEFAIVGGSPETQAIAWTLKEIQSRASASTFISFRYDFIAEKLHI